MATQFPQESAWKGVVKKHQLTDNGLQKALAAYEKLGEDKPVERIKALDAAKKLAASLAKVKEVAANAEASKFLDQLGASAESTKKLVAAAAAKGEARADSEEKIDLSKLKSLTEAIGKLAALSKAGKAGSDAAKDGGVMACAAEVGATVAAAAALYRLYLEIVVETAAIAATRGRAARLLLPKLLANITLFAAAAVVFHIALKKSYECYKRNDNPAQREYEARARQVQELHAHLVREKERLGRRAG